MPNHASPPPLLSETTPLLTGHNDSPLSPPSPSPDRFNTQSSAHKPWFLSSSPALQRGPGKWQAQTPLMVVIVATVFKFSVTLSGTVMLLSFLRLLEDALCHQFYEDTSPDLIDEERCKVGAVQERLAYLMGVFGMASAVISMLVALPYGILADKFGRKPIIYLAYGCQAISFLLAPVWLYLGRDHNLYYMLIGNVFQLGGGIPVIITTLYSVAADVTSETDRATGFLYLTLGAIAGGLLGPLLSGLIMQFLGPWVAIFLVVFITPFILALLTCLPETLPLKPDTELPLLGSENLLPVTRGVGNVLKAMRDSINTSLTELRIASTLLQNRSILLCMSAFFVQNPIFVANSTTLIQYLSAHFHWKIAQTAFLLAPLGLLSLLVVLLMPALGSYLLPTKIALQPKDAMIAPFRRDALLTRLSFAFHLAGFVSQAISPTIYLFLASLTIGTLGSAASPLSRALLSHHIPRSMTSRVMALTGVFETLGALFGGPVLAFWFAKGQEWGDVMRGAPFLYAAFLVFGVLVALFFVQAPLESTDEDGHEEEDPILS